LAAEYRRALLDRWFAAARRGSAPARPIAVRPPIEAPAVREARARNLLAILLQHPALLPELEEALATLSLPTGACARIQAALLDVAAQGGPLDSPDLLDQLAGGGLEGDVLHVVRGPGLSAAASAAAQPRDALDAWWHFFGLLRGEAELLADRAEAERMLVETNDPAAQRRLIRLTEALAALRGGEAAEALPIG
ncbi:MAG TPA: DNA primase, partial [Crenalkalicoccus sp.]|nr:DNA primase [Crenalkalicoccus sp.]